MKKIGLFLYLITGIYISVCGQTLYDYYDDKDVIGGTDNVVNSILIVVILVIVAVFIIFLLGGGLKIYYWFNPKASPEYKAAKAKDEKERQKRIFEDQKRREAKPIAIDLGLSVKWASFNLGAYKPSDIGDKYYWAENNPSRIGYPKFDKVNVNTMGDIGGNPEFDAATNAYGNNWRLPSDKECEELIRLCNWEIKILDGVEGAYVTGPSGNSIFIPFNQSYSSDNKSGHYWTSCPSFKSGMYESSKDLRFGYHCKKPAELWYATAARCLFSIRPVFSEEKKDNSKEKKEALEEFSKLRNINISTLDNNFELYESLSLIDKEKDIAGTIMFGPIFNEETTIVDNYGVRYSKDGIRLIEGTRCKTDYYHIKEGTKIICKNAFKLSGAQVLNRETLKCSKIELPKSLLYLSASSIPCIEIISNSPYYILIKDFLIDLRKKSIVKFLNNHLQKIFIGEPIKEIEDEAFFYLEFIKEVYLPPTIKRIGIRSFMNCRMLNYISIPDSVIIIEEQAFCLTDLKSVLVSKKTIIKERAFPGGCQINYRD